MHLCSLSITYACPYWTPPPPWATRSTTLRSANRSPTQRHTCCLPSALYSENRDLSVKRTPLQSARRHRMWAFCPFKSVTTMNCSQVEPPMRTTSMQMSFSHWTVKQLQNTWNILHKNFRVLYNVCVPFVGLKNNRIVHAQYRIRIGLIWQYRSRYRYQINASLLIAFK